MEINPKDLNTKDSHELFVSGILPRPIALVSTVGEDGVFNLAAFSCFTMVGFRPALACFYAGVKRDGVKKDTVVNIEFAKDFVVNIVDEALAEAMNQASAEYPSDVDEFKEVGLTPAKSELIRAPRVAESPVNMECKLTQILESGEAAAGGHIIIGEVVRVHIKDELWAGDQIDVSKLKPIGRLGGDLYCRITDIFEMKRAFIP
jgi:flavin reductase (DIM6/NTAB) family NADH-FMN oxidoreductase RutF